MPHLVRLTTYMLIATSSLTLIGSDEINDPEEQSNPLARRVEQHDFRSDGLLRFHPYNNSYNNNNYNDTNEEAPLRYNQNNLRNLALFITAANLLNQPSQSNQQTQLMAPQDPITRQSYQPTNHCRCFPSASIN